MAIITLISDMGVKDHYVAAVKGAILSQLPEASIVDISHQVEAFNTGQAAFILGNAWHEFPEGTIHILGVNPEGSGKNPYMVVRHQGHFFIGADSGVFYMLFNKQPDEAIELTLKLENDHQTFPAKTLFTRVACHLAKGGSVDVLGRRVPKVKESFGPRPVVDGDSMRGQVIHIDHYGNVMTNITRELFKRLVKHHRFVITVGPSEHNINKVHKCYGDVSPGALVAFFGDTGHLEVAVNKGAPGSGGGAAQLLGLRVNHTIRVELENVPDTAVSS